MDKIIIDDKEIKKWISSNLSLILLASEKQIIRYINQKEVEIFKNKFLLSDNNFMKKWGRICLQNILGNVSPKKRWYFTSYLKNLRKIYQRKLLKPSLCLGTKTILAIARRMNVPFRDWQGKCAVVCLTHDVDTSVGYNFIPQLINIENKFKIKTSFNFLTEGEYELKENIFLLLKKNGFEIGLHGATHDISFGYQKKEKIEKIISTITNQKNFSRCGFRSPALSISNRLIQILDKYGISYDSSVSIYYEKLAGCYPYFFPKTKVWELPLCLQDDVLFRDFKLKENQAFFLVKEFIEDIKKINGVCVLNFHPILIKNNFNCYKKILGFLNKQTDILITTGGELVNLMNERKSKK